MPPASQAPQDLLVTSYSDYHETAVTPRTPHSRAGRAEEGFTTVELETFGDDESTEYHQQQSQPLLSSGYRSRGDDHNLREKSYSADRLSFRYWFQAALDALPLFAGSVLAILLFVFIIFSFKQPGVLESSLLGKVVAISESKPSSQPSAPSVDPQAPSATTEASNLLISYENYTSFPLTGDQYRAECAKLMGMWMKPMPYWYSPPEGSRDVLHKSNKDGGKVCSSTITYMLDGHVGLAADLALMAHAAAFARERGRTFLVDDTHWNRGKWTDHFQDVRELAPGPEPGCLAPPPEELVACPRTARHWVLSSRTARYHFGDHFLEEYENPFGHHMNRVKPIYENLRISLEQVIRPNERIATLIRTARDELASALSLSHPPSPRHVEDSSEGKVAVPADPSTQPANPAPYIGVHIRRGDRLASAFMFYPQGIIPLEKFVTGTRETWDRFYDNTSSPIKPNSSSPNETLSPPIVWLATDGPAALLEFEAAFPPATALFSLARSGDGMLRAIAPFKPYVQKEFNEEPPLERARLTRGAIVDFAMVSGLWARPGDVVPGATVCMEMSNMCRLAALGFGFERAFGFDDDGDYFQGDPNPKRARWVDVDIAGRVIPAWDSFEAH